MAAKDELKKKFSSDPNTYYRVKLFDEMDFLRRKCEKCGAFFWTLDEDRRHCPNPPCESYGFIGKPMKKKMNYVETWNEIEKFFVKNGHTAVPSYPAVCRWFPGLYFTVASIVAFQRAVGNKTVFEMPANPLIIPQSCMRFNDVPNVGVTGRHFTNFTMIGQHSIYDGTNGYWKDRCVELDFNLLTKVFGIPEKEINFIEDVWVGPNAFGYSLEYYFRGLELGNAVFTEFVGTPERYKQMDKKVIDMGAGLERFAWISQGTPTAYDAVFGPVIEKLLKQTPYDMKFWLEYSKVAGRFNMEDFKNYREAKAKIAGEMLMETDELIEATAPVEAMYAIADHAKSLLFAVADGGLPSNVGGGYNLRVILRRALGFIDEFGFDVDLFDVCNDHAKYLKSFNPRLKEAVEGLGDIIDVERYRYRTTKKRGENILKTAIAKNEKFTTEKLIELYESNGITPETIEKIAKKENVNVDIPTDFYDILSSKHMKEKPAEQQKVDVEDVQPTKILFYDVPETEEFDAKVLRIIDSRYVILDKSAFYGKSGGQQGDVGWLNGCRVYDTEKYGDVIVHLVDAPNFSVGDEVHGKIDWNVRVQLMQHHTAVHVLHGSAHRVLGNHVWQAGSNKTIEKAHLDITHYKPLTEEDVEKIEDIANATIKKSIAVKKFVIPRTEAEQKYGFTLYQGGAVPHSNLRVIEIPDFDVEACGGTHCNNTSEIKKIIITSSERIQDGIVRINIVAGDAAQKYFDGQEEIFSRVKKILSVNDDKIISAAENLFSRWKLLRKELEKSSERGNENIISDLEKKIIKNILIAEIDNADGKKLQTISQNISNDDRVVILLGVSDKIYIFGSAGKNSTVNIGEIISDVCKELGGRGGGSAKVGLGIGFEKNKIDSVIKKIEARLL
jgi:alanyl-tRNA synthetase